jgi:hypothetical protein
MVSEDDGGGTLENTLKYFKKYGKHKGKFNDYYATVHFAEQALAESVSGGITEAELKILVAYDDAIGNEYNTALNQISQEFFDRGMLVTSREPLALRGAELGFDLLPEVTSSEKKTDLLTAVFPTNISILKHIFRNAPGHFAEDTAINRALMTDTVQSRYLVEADSYGNQIYARQLSNGTEIWVEVRNGTIRNGGLNELPRWAK